jgi:hypothetical protein
MNTSVVLSPGIISDGRVALMPGTGELQTAENAPLSVISPKHPEGAWLHTFCFFIPKIIREPYLGDLGEDRARMYKEGYSRAKIEWATVSQVFWLSLWLVKELVMEILTPFKNGNR